MPTILQKKNKRKIELRLLTLRKTAIIYFESFHFFPNLIIIIVYCSLIMYIDHNLSSQLLNDDIIYEKSNVFLSLSYPCSYEFIILLSEWWFQYRQIFDTTVDFMVVLWIFCRIHIIYENYYIAAILYQSFRH